jgi:UPF0271 protein
MSMKGIRINCDLGEGVGNEPQVMPLIQQCNIACGGHAGDKETMQNVVALALTYGVEIGAHPSYPDRENFGRVTMTMDGEDLIESIRSQVGSLLKVVLQAGAKLHHIKPHGALYNDIAGDEDLARTFLDAVAPYKDDVRLVVPYGSLMAKLASDAGFLIYLEAFADRAYHNNHTLVSRKLEGAVLHEPHQVLEHVKNMVHFGEVRTIEGERIPMDADTYCVHSDTPNAFEILKMLNQLMRDA